jgi:cell division protein FtsZ
MNDDSEYIDDEALSPQFPTSRLSIRLFGVGSAGCNLIKNITLNDVAGDVRLTVIDTDLNSLQSMDCDEVIRLGIQQTRGLGTGGDAGLGELAAKTDIEKIKDVVRGADLVFIFAGLGGGTGSGVTPLLAEEATHAGALVISFVSMPFSFQGRVRQEVAEESLLQLRKNSDAVIPLPNDVLIQQGREDVNVIDAFAAGNLLIEEAIYSICSLLLKTGLINVDFPHLKSVFTGRGGRTLFATGSGKGDNAVQEALNDLLQCPLLHIQEQSKAADHLLVNIQGGRDLKMPAINHIMKTLTERFCSMEDTVFGATLNESFKDEVHITVLGTTDMRSGRVARTENEESSLGHPSELDVEPIKERAHGGDELLKVPVHESKKKALRVESNKQGEFDFNFDDTGYFQQTEKNFYRNQDLDVPTYHRKGIQIVI